MRLHKAERQRKTGPTDGAWEQACTAVAPAIRKGEDKKAGTLHLCGGGGVAASAPAMCFSFYLISMIHVYVHTPYVVRVQLLLAVSTYVDYKYTKYFFCAVYHVRRFKTFHTRL